MFLRSWFASRQTGIHRSTSAIQHRPGASPGCGTSPSAISKQDGESVPHTIELSAKPGASRLACCSGFAAPVNRHGGYIFLSRSQIFQWSPASLEVKQRAVGAATVQLGSFAICRVGHNSPLSWLVAILQTTLCMKWRQPCVDSDQSESHGEVASTKRRGPPVTPGPMTDKREARNKIPSKPSCGCCSSCRIRWSAFWGRERA
jgi:hypothetical protein